MSEPGKAVFLSYASQDAEAAKRICEALRAAGVEVWFDQSELVGGDAWDAKIRGQIGNCALFLPLISANTQTRLEGYFRIEWKLAAKRTHAMAAAKAFLLPVVIDDTRDGDAHVPEEFREVQWTKAPGGAVPPFFAGRVKQLLEEGVSRGATDFRPAREPGVAGREPSPPMGNRRARSRWLLPAFVAVLVLAGGGALLMSRRGDRSPVESRPQVAGLLATARDLLDTPTRARFELEAADRLCEQATALDSFSAEAWALWSLTDSWRNYFNYDNSDQRREAARSKAEKALQLAPASFDARLAQASYLVLANAHSSAMSPFASKAEAILRELSHERATDPSVLLVTALLQRNQGNTNGAREALRALANQPRFAGMAWTELGWAEMGVGDFAAAQVAAERAFAATPYWNSVILRTEVALWWEADLAKAKAIFDRLPANSLLEDYGICEAIQLAEVGGDHPGLLAMVASVPRDWLQSGFFEGPTRYFAGLAHAQLGNQEAARQSWSEALRVVEAKLAAAPQSPELLIWKSRLQGLQGDVAAAAGTFALFRQLAGDRILRGEIGFERAADYWLVGRKDEAIAYLEKTVPAGGLTWAVVQLHPRLAPLRGDARVQALLARMRADPRLAPAATSVPANFSAEAGPLGPLPADAKSVAVLAFANLSDDKGNEYFSDGISEELLNQLGKVAGLRVAGRASSFSFKGQNVPEAEIAGKLGVAYVVTGSVQKSGNQVRITARLVKAADGFQVWSDKFTRDLKDIFAVQDEIAGLIAQQLQLKLAASERAKRVVDPEAYRLVLEGRQFWNLRTEEGFTKAETAFTRALGIDPQFAEAHSGLAGVCAIRSVYRQLDGMEVDGNDIRRASEEGLRALELDAGSGEACAVLGYVELLSNRLETSDRRFQQALALNPNSALVHCWYALLLAVQGRLEASLEHYGRAAEIDPLWFINLQLFGITCEFGQRFERALEINDRGAALRTDVFIPNLASRARLLLYLGRTDEAIAAARQVLQQPAARPRWTSDPSAIHVLWQGGRRQEAEAAAARLLAELPAGSYLRGFVLAAIGRFEEALPLLEKTPSAQVRVIYWETMWDAWRDDPRFAELMARFGRTAEYKLARETLTKMQRERGK